MIPVANGTIKHQRLDYLSINVTQKEVAQETATELCTIALPPGVWVVISYMALSKSGNNTYNHTLAGRTVRNWEKSGGGSINTVLVNAGNGGMNISLNTYLTITGGCTVSYAWQAFRIQ